MQYKVKILVKQDSAQHAKLYGIAVHAANRKAPVTYEHSPNHHGGLIAIITFDSKEVADWTANIFRQGYGKAEVIE